MANLFKTRFLPNQDGTDSATPINDANTAFVHTYLGDDFTGDGTREYPFKSVNKATQKSGINFIVFKGVVNEYFWFGGSIIGDDINQTLLQANYSPYAWYFYNITTDYINVDRVGTSFFCSIFNSNLSTGIQAFYVDDNKCYSFFKSLIVTSLIAGSSNSFINCTVSNLVGNVHYRNEDSWLINNTIKNFIISEYFDPIQGGYYVFCNLKYFIFLSTCVFYYQGQSIVQPIWTNDSKANIQLLRNAYLVAGMSQIDVDSIFVKDSFGNETCRIVKEQRNGGTSENVFNGYDDAGNVTDYSLNPASNNEALYASDLGGYVGCFKPTTPVISTMWNTPIDVNSDGSDTVNAGTLARINDDQTIDFNTASLQVWNRIKSNTTINVPNGIKFNGIDAMSTDGSAFGYYFGKHQNLMDATALTPADALEANTIYKVCNINWDIYSAVVFNGIQYLPDYFFKTGNDVLNFTLLNDGSGTVVRKVLATPMESIEIMPYDDAVTPSVSFPNFSCPLFGNVQMLYHKIGDNIDKPVLFSEVDNDKISYYDDYAVTNADQEFVTLAADTVNYYYKIPVLKYLRTELNAHYNADYDQ